MSDAKHTPTPWFSKLGPYPEDGEFNCAISSVANPGVIAECFGRIEETRTEDAEANAAFIVRAVNSHDEMVLRGSHLVAALRAWQEKSRQAAPVKPYQTPEYEDFCKMVEAIEALNWAIQTARGQS